MFALTVSHSLFKNIFVNNHSFTKSGLLSSNLQTVMFSLVGVHFDEFLINIRSYIFTKIKIQNIFIKYF